MPPEDVKKYFKFFKTAENRINLYAIFIERCYSLLSIKGVLCFINPNSILVNESYKKLRKLIVNDIKQIVKLPDNVFHSATVETIIFMLQNNSSINYALGKFFKNSDSLKLENLEFETFEKNDWKLDEQCRFNIFTDKKIQKVIKKMDLQGNILEDFVETTLGITPYDKAKGHSKELIKSRGFHSKTKVDNTYVPLISGKNIHPYFLTDEIEEYLKYGDWLGAPRQKKFFENEKIIVRQILGGNELKIIAGYSNRPHYFTQIGFSIILKENCSIKLKYLLALLNSKALCFYHKNKFLDIEKVVFQKILIANAKLFPIPQATKEQQQKIISLVDEILVAKKSNPNANTLELEHKIDEIVYELYGLSKPEIDIVEGK